MYLWWSVCTLYLQACQVRVTVGDSSLCCLHVWRLSSANYLPCVLILWLQRCLLLHCRYHVKLLPSRRKFWVHYTDTTTHQFTVSLFEATYVGFMHLVFNYILPPSLLAEWPGFLRATTVTRWWNRYRNKSPQRKLALQMKFLPPLLPGLEPETFRSRVRRSNHWAILATLKPVLNWANVSSRT